MTRLAEDTVCMVLVKSLLPHPKSAPNKVKNKLDVCDPGLLSQKQWEAQQLPKP